VLVGTVLEYIICDTMYVIHVINNILIIRRYIVIKSPF